MTGQRFDETDDALGATEARLLPRMYVARDHGTFLCGPFWVVAPIPAHSHGGGLKVSINSTDGAVRSIDRICFLDAPPGGAGSSMSAITPIADKYGSGWMSARGALSGFAEGAVGRELPFHVRFTPKSGHCSALGDVRFVPKADIRTWHDPPFILISTRHIGPSELGTHRSRPSVS